MKYTLIPQECREKKRCYYCGASKSVKYMCSVYHPIVDTKPVKIYVCNRCASIHALEIIDIS